MKRLELIELKLTNFKGIERFSLVADGFDTDVLGDNATGKTTTFDAFTFLLFGKDSNNKSDFEIKALDETGKVKQHGLEHTVEGIFRFEENIFTLKRVYAESWTKKRGSNKKVFSGHTTKYYIDDVPKKKKEFDEKVSSIISEDVFKLLTNPLYFNESVEWKKRREILIEIAGDVSESEIVEADESLESILKKLEGKDIDDLKKVIKEKQKDINKELDVIPIRIDEINLSSEDISNLNKSVLKGDREVLLQEIDECMKSMESIGNGVEINAKRKAMSDLDLELVELKNKNEQQGMNEVYKLQAGIQEKESNVSLLNNKKEAYESQIEAYRGQVELLDVNVDRLRNEWLEEDSRDFNHTENCVCPTCEQDLPEEKVEEAKNNFNMNKSKKLESIVIDGNKAKEEKEKILLSIEKLENKIVELEKEMDKENKKIIVLKSELEGLEGSSTSNEYDSIYKEKESQKQALQDEILALIDSNNVMIDEKKDELKKLEEKKEAIEKELVKFDYKEKAEKRIAELEEKESKLAIEFEKLDAELFQLEKYVKTKIYLLEEKINNKFKFAKFKLFEEQINAGIRETCEVLYKGVPYSRGLNNASRINVGLDVINTLNNHFNISVPIFIDNSESVTELIDTESQLVKLVVDEKYKELTVSPNKKIEKTA